MRLFSSILFVLFLFGFEPNAHGQGYVFGPKIGPTIGLQQWNSLERDPLLSWHGALFIESYDEDSPSSLYAQLGYHNRGSAIRAFDFFTGSNFSSSFVFKNISLGVGAKRLIGDGNWKPYYHFGLRLEYTVDTNLDEYEEFNQFLFYPIDIFVNKWNYGLSFGGGFQTQIAELIGAAFEFTISPDVSLQYEQMALSTPIQFPNGQVSSLGARNIRNLTFEASLVLRLHRKIEYY